MAILQSGAVELFSLAITYMFAFDFGSFVELCKYFFSQTLFILEFFLDDGKLLTIFVTELELPVRGVLVFELAALLTLLVTHLDWDGCYLFDDKFVVIKAE